MEDKQVSRIFPFHQVNLLVFEIKIFDDYFFADWDDF